MSPLARTGERKRATHREPSMSAIYERDFYSWCMHQALALKTTADVTTVDGGNIAAALR